MVKASSTGPSATSISPTGDQEGHRAPVLLADDPLDLRGAGLGHAGRQSSASCAKDRTSMGRVVTRASLLPHSSAASRSAAFTIVKPPRYS